MFIGILFSIAVLIIIILLSKIISMKRNIVQISKQLNEYLYADTNTLITTSSNDKIIEHLADSLNKELRLLRKQRLKYLSGDSELKEAVTNIAHDLRTPLTAICGYLDLLESEEKSAVVSRYVALIENRTENLKQLTEEMFRYSIIMSTVGDIHLKNENINRLLEKNVATFYADLTKKGIAPLINIPEKEIWCNIDSVALNRVLNNLMANALKYSDGDLDISLLDSGNIIFSNSTSNINDIQVGQLFNRFFSVETAKKGTGLGLSIAKTLIEQMNGKISAQYIENKLIITISLNPKK